MHLKAYVKDISLGPEPCFCNLICLSNTTWSIAIELTIENCYSTRYGIGNFSSTLGFLNSVYNFVHHTCLVFTS